MNGFLSNQVIKYSVTFFFCLLLVSLNAYGQSIIGVADYMKVENQQEYIEIESKWQNIHKERLKQGMIVGWAVYQVMFKTPEDPYNFITVSWYDSFSKLDKEVPLDLIQSVYPDMDKEDIKAFHRETEQSRKRIASGVFHQRMTTANGLDNLGKFYVINEIKVKQGKSKQLLKIYEEIYKPLFEEDIRQNNRTNWSFWEKWPGNMEDFQYLAADAYSSLEQIEQVNYLAYFSKIHPDKNIDDISQKVEELRELISTEMWKLIYRIN